MTTTIEQQTEIENQRICSRLVEREVLHCISATVSHFAQNVDACSGDVDYDDVMTLLSGEDWETPWSEHVAQMGHDELLEFINCHECDIEYEEFDGETGDVNPSHDDDQLREAVRIYDAESAQELCPEYRIAPEQSEALEHWAVTKWFKEKLAEHGEITGELLDFEVWGRCCSGQAISMDGVIREIASEMQILVGQHNTWAE
jgi:hypothetical protein